MRRHIVYGVCGLVLMTACRAGSGGGDATPVAEATPESAAAAAKPAGKPSAPVDIDYDVIGTPVVGQPVSIDLSVKSTRGEAPVRLRYRVLDGQSMSFPATQARDVALRVGATEPAIRQITVVPQREGRLYVNVTAEVDTDAGTLIKAIAIPVQVGSGPAEREPNGTLEQDPDGDAVISLPADET
ncbi:MAG TPA: hypothetical protein VF200_13850 [Woeseiaceae bacterium]